MTQETKITCDSCDNDITNTGGMPAYRLNLSYEALPHIGNTVLAVMVYPPLEKFQHFCGLGCLKRWVEKKEI